MKWVQLIANVLCRADAKRFAVQLLIRINAAIFLRTQWHIFNDLWLLLTVNLTRIINFNQIVLHIWHYKGALIACWDLVAGLRWRVIRVTILNTRQEHRRFLRRERHVPKFWWHLMENVWLNVLQASLPLIVTNVISSFGLNSSVYFFNFHISILDQASIWIYILRHLLLA